MDNEKLFEDWRKLNEKKDKYNAFFVGNIFFWMKEWIMGNHNLEQILSINEFWIFTNLDLLFKKIDKRHLKVFHNYAFNCKHSSSKIHKVLM